MTRRELVVGAMAAAAAAGRQTARTKMGITTDCFPSSKQPKTALAFLEYCHKFGAGGVESALGPADPDYLRQVRKRVEEYGMYYGAWASTLPGADTTAFERTVAAAKEAGATCLRSFCLGGRRYEVFDGRVAELRGRIARPHRAGDPDRGEISHSARTGEPQGLDARRDAAIAPRVRLEYVGVCLDTGNDILPAGRHARAGGSAGAVHHQRAPEGHGRWRICGRFSFGRGAARRRHSRHEVDCGYRCPRARTRGSRWR